MLFFKFNLFFEGVRWEWVNEGVALFRVRNGG